ncbi:Tyrosine-protein kinase Fes/Fps OS=Mus musculus GN=Fes PE=1 SV=2 [Rhizoctonia solani AG-1 IB]|uniref:Tyrosine-protein kinase Fes/Fps n=1 Tax=Thanatephorus cucumeris (strain AG1-IB / isolate 7/3/14) TaxID=1108050 RepID=A0A0B7FAX2_THACB|nr:Tyrosine-protein kinase Fes/Fps OS=Mus musculus GN=Fes PE=1 SV=2 [Rhizoctonia solani AG-1 IB]
MECDEIVALLARHHCMDLTEFLDHSHCSTYPVAHGGLGDVFSGKLVNGIPIAIKTIRGYGDYQNLAGKYQKRAAKEIHTWSKCMHPNVAELLGIAVFRNSLAMISRWEENGNMIRYLAHYPSADRCALSASICAGLTYLHGSNIVHGDLKGANVLVDRDGVPMLTDFGSASLQDDTLQVTRTTTGAVFSIRWTAPEILNGGRHSAIGDVYSLGMTILEAFTGSVPFPEKPDLSILAHILIHKSTPTQPEAIPARSECGDQLWLLLNRCWSHEPAERPSAKIVWEEMKLFTPEKLQEVEDELGRGVE